MNKTVSDFRQIFGTLAPQAIVSRSELAELLNTSEGAISQMVYRGELPKTAFPGKRRCCWFVRDIRFWLDEKHNLDVEPTTSGSTQTVQQKNRIGRPRSKVDHIR